MTLRPLLAAAGAALALAAAPAAQAATYDLIFTGTLDAGVDTLNLFGGNVQVGDALSVTYRYDTSLGGTRSGIPGVYDELDTDFPFTPAAITQATLRMDGYSYSYTPDFQASVSVGVANFDQTSGGYDVDGAYASGQSLAGDNSAFVFQIGSSQTLPTDLNTPMTIKGFGLGYFLTAFSTDNQSDNFEFEASSASISAAPEPALWSLMILAIGGLGGALRLKGRRRQVLKAAA